MKQARVALLVRAGAMLLAASSFWGCGSSTESEDATKEDVIVRGPEWNETSHGKLAVPDTAGAFPTSSRRTMILSFSDTAWKNIVNSVKLACGEDGSSASCTGSGLDAYDAVSDWHEASIVTDGKVWAHVGIRLRSNSELANAWKDKTRYRFPFRITMDKWEDKYVSIDNQRFYGFQKLSLANLAEDSTQLRHQVASYVYRANGIPAFRSTLVKLRVAYGAGANDTLELGVYSLREMLDGPMLSRWFSGNDGNLYEPTSWLAAADVNNTQAFASGDNDKTYADVLGFMKALHASNRTTDRGAWRTGLESVFDVNGFINWLALSTVLGDRGSYGYSNENYALYADQGKLRWMALDADETLPTGNALYRGPWHQKEIDENGASLIDFMLSDPVYCESYKTKLGGYVASVLESGALTARVGALSSQLLPGSTIADKLKAYADIRKTAIGKDSIDAHSCGSN